MIRRADLCVGRGPIADATEGVPPEIGKKSPPEGR